MDKKQQPNKAAGEEQVHIARDTTDHKYFILTQQLVWAKCRDVYDLSLWFAVKMIAGDAGECYLGTRRLATLAMMSIGKCSDCRSYLMSVGLLKGEKIQVPGEDNEVWHLWIPDLWTDNVTWRQTIGDKLKTRIAMKAAQKELLKEHAAKVKATPKTQRRNLPPLLLTGMEGKGCSPDEHPPCSPDEHPHSLDEHPRSSGELKENHKGEPKKEEPEKESGNKKNEKTTVIDAIIEQTEQHPDLFDLALETEEAQKEGGCWTAPPAAGGDDGAAEAALAAMYNALDSEPPQKHTKSWDAEIAVVGQVLRARGVTEPEVAGLAGELMGQANKKTPHFCNPLLSTFPSSFGCYVGKAKKQMGGDRRAQALTHAEESQRALAERQAAAKAAQPEDSPIGAVIKRELKLQMPARSFETYVQPCAITQEDGTLRITAPTDETRKWIESRLQQTIGNILKGLALSGSLEIRLEVAQ